MTKEQKKRLLKLLKKARNAFSAGDFQKSFGLLQEAYALKGDPEYLYRMGLCQDRANNPKKALKYYRKYLEQKPDSNKRGSVEKTIAQLEERVDEVQPEEEPDQDREQEEATAEKTDDEGGGLGSQRTWAIVTTSVAGVSTIGAVIFGVLYGSANSTFNEWRNNPRDHTRSEVKDKASQSNLYLGLTFGSAGLAVATGSVSTVLWLQSGPETQSQAGRTNGLDLGVRFTLNGIQLEGRF